MTTTARHGGVLSIDGADFWVQDDVDSSPNPSVADGYADPNRRRPGQRFRERTSGRGETNLERSATLTREVDGKHRARLNSMTVRLATPARVYGSPAATASASARVATSIMTTPPTDGTWRPPSRRGRAGTARRTTRRVPDVILEFVWSTRVL